jgi:hypothetical protein
LLDLVNGGLDGAMCGNWIHHFCVTTGNSSKDLEWIIPLRF